MNPKGRSDRGGPRGVRNPLAARSRPLVEAMAAEWRSLGEEIDPAKMPLTRLLTFLLIC